MSDAAIAMTKPAIATGMNPERVVSPSATTPTTDGSTVSPITRPAVTVVTDARCRPSV